MSSQVDILEKEVSWPCSYLSLGRMTRPVSLLFQLYSSLKWLEMSQPFSTECMHMHTYTAYHANNFQLSTTHTHMVRGPTVSCGLHEMLWVRKEKKIPKYHPSASRWELISPRFVKTIRSPVCLSNTRPRRMCISSGRRMTVYSLSSHWSSLAVR